MIRDAGAVSQKIRLWFALCFILMSAEFYHMSLLA